MPYTLNPFTGNFDYFEDVETIGDARFLKLDQSTPQTVTGTPNMSISGNASTVTTNANMTGDVTSVGNATTLADWSGGNVTYVPLTGDIATYITNATAGDTLVLAAGTYTITSGLTVNKKLHIMGQGQGITTIACATADVTMITTSTTAGSLISDLTLQTTATNSNTVDFKAMINPTVSTNISNVEFLNAGIMAGGTKIIPCIYTATASITINVYNSMFTITGASPFHTFLDVRANSTINAYNCSGTQSGGTTAGGGIVVFTSNSGTINLWKCDFSTSENYTGGLILNTGTAINIYGGSYNASGANNFDVKQTAGTLTVYAGTNLVNNTTSGTITYGGTSVSNKLLASSLTSGRITYAGTSGLLQDSANLTYDGTSLTFKSTGGSLYINDTAGYPDIQMQANGARTWDIYRNNANADLVFLNSESGGTSNSLSKAGLLTLAGGVSTTGTGTFGSSISIYRSSLVPTCSCTYDGASINQYYNSSEDYKRYLDIVSSGYDRPSSIRFFNQKSNSVNPTVAMQINTSGSLSLFNDLTFDGTGTTTNPIVNNAKMELIEDVNQLVGTTYIKGFWIFDQVGATTSITDRSPNGHTVTLGGNASTLSPAVAGVCPNLNFQGTSGTSWSAADHNDFSFGNGAGVDSAFTVIALYNPTNIASNFEILAKDNNSNQREWLFDTAAGKPSFYVIKLDGSAYIGRYYNASIASDNGSWHVYCGTASGGSPQAVGGLKIYRDGVQIDDTSTSSGSYGGMTNGTAVVGGVGAGNYTNAKGGVAIIISKELTAEEVARISKRLLAYSGSFQ